MKKILTLLAVLIVLAAAAYYLRPADDGSSSIDTRDRAFAYEDEDNIGKIVLKKVDWDEQVFERRGEDWYVNGYLVAPYKITTLLNGITRARIEHLPPKNTIPTVYDFIEKQGVSVKVYDKRGKEVRSYTVAQNSHNGRCTYFLMDGATQPYCINLKGAGKMRPRFVQQIDIWRDVALYRVPPEDIETLTVEYPKDYTSSFEIRKKGSSYDVIDIGSKTTGKEISQQAVKNYLSGFEELYGEGFANNYGKKDSVAKLVPFMRVSMTKKGGEVQTIQLYPREEVEFDTEETNDLQDSEQIEKFLVITSSGDLMLAQQELLMPILRPYDYFLATD